MSEKRTLAKFVHDWLTNLVIIVPLITGLGGLAAYGNSETVKGWVHGNNSPLTVEEVTPEVGPMNYDRILKELIELNKKQDKQMIDINQSLNQIRLDIKDWHE